MKKKQKKPQSNQNSDINKIVPIAAQYKYYHKPIVNSKNLKSNFTQNYNDYVDLTGNKIFKGRRTNEYFSQQEVGGGNIFDDDDFLKSKFRDENFFIKNLSSSESNNLSKEEDNEAEEDEEAEKDETQENNTTFNKYNDNDDDESLSLEIDSNGEGIIKNNLTKNSGFLSRTQEEIRLYRITDFSVKQRFLFPGSTVDYLKILLFYAPYLSIFNYYGRKIWLDFFRTAIAEHTSKM